MLDYAQARKIMVDSQLRTFDVTDRAVLAAMGEVPRAAVVAPARQALAYLDQTIPETEADGPHAGRYGLAPMMLARMLQALEIEAGTKVLDVAGGRGYSAAILSALGAEVVALESTPERADDMAARIASNGLGARVTARSGPLADGFPTGAPYGAVLVNGAVDSIPPVYLDQLHEGGRLACLQRDGRAGRAMLYVKGSGGVGTRILFDATCPILAEFQKAPAFTF